MKIVLLLPILLTLASCSTSIKACPKRPHYKGTTWGDIASYTKGLEDLYDSCSK